MRCGFARPAGLLVAILLGFSVLPGSVQAQSTARVQAELENFRREPNGVLLATLARGTQLAVIQTRGAWVEAELEGWVWAPSVVQTVQDGFDLRVEADNGENLRTTPRGRIKARLQEGCLLERLGTSGNWYQVRRRGWIWRMSLQVSGLPAAAGPAGAASQPQARPVEQESGEQAIPVVTVSTPVVVHATPDGDTVATFQPGAQAQILGRTGDWYRVRMDGWLYGPAALETDLELLDTGDVTPAQLRADPGRYRGALVRWRVQFISLRRAEPARSDFTEGEPFIHARGAAGDAGFVYLAVPEELLPLAESLQPLAYVTVAGRVRTGRSSQLGSPVIDLTDIEPEEPRN